MALGEIVVALLAKTGSFETDIDRSTKAVEKRMREMRKTVNDAGAAFGLALTAGAAAATIFTKRWIDQLDALNDASDATGASIENLSAIEDIAVRTGTSMDAATGMIVKFNQGLKGMDDDGKTAKIIERLGLNIDDLRKMDPAEALMEVAKALAQWADDGDKARVVQELFGKSVREVAPLLKDLAEKGELVATVTTQQAKEAEAFNKELFAMEKNVTDLGRSFASDLVTGINNAANAYRQNGSVWDAIKMLFGGTDEYKANKRFADLTSDLVAAEQEVDRMKARSDKLPFGLGEERVKDAQEAVKKLKAELAPLLAARTADTSYLDLETKRLTDRRPAIGPVDTSKDKKAPKGPDQDADFKAYLNTLEQQIQKVDELTVSEKLLDDVRRGHLTVTRDQQAQLTILAATVDKQKERALAMKEGRARAIEEGEAVEKGNEAYQARFKTLLDSGPEARLEAQRKDMQALAEEFERGRITAQQFNDAATGALGLDQKAFEDLNFELTDTQNLLMDMGQAGTRALEDLALHGDSASEVFKNLLQNVAQLIFQLGVAQPLMAGLRGGIGGGVMPPNPDAGFSLTGLLTTAASAIFGGARAGGGPVQAGKAYLVGENGTETFVPRTAGMVLPNSAFGSGKMNISVVNQTTGRVDDVQQRGISPTEMALILRETRKAVAGDFGDNNSAISQSLRRHTTARKKVV